MAEKSYKRRVRNMLVDISFQVKYTVLVVLVSIVIFMVLGYLIVNEWNATDRIMDDINPIVKAGMEAPLTPEAKAELEELGQVTGAQGLDSQELQNLNSLDGDYKVELSRRTRQRSAMLIGVVGLLVVVLAGISVWLSHKAAGPVYAVMSFIQAARLGQWSRIRPLRKGDEFKYLGDEFLGLVQDIRKREAADLQLLDECSVALDADNTARIRELLDELRTTKVAYLEEKK